jgi:hypothetical protein
MGEHRRRHRCGDGDVRDGRECAEPDKGERDIPAEQRKKDEPDDDQTAGRPRHVHGARPGK